MTQPYSNGVTGFCFAARNFFARIYFTRGERGKKHVPIQASMKIRFGPCPPLPLYTSAVWEYRSRRRETHSIFTQSRSNCFQSPFATWEDKKRKREIESPSAAAGSNPNSDFELTFLLPPALSTLKREKNEILLPDLLSLRDKTSKLNCLPPRKKENSYSTHPNRKKKEGEENG